MSTAQHGAASYAAIKNNKGMSAQVIACAYGDAEEGHGRKTVYCLDIAGSHTAVKAIWASVMSGSPLKPQGFASYKILRADKEADFAVTKSTPLQHVHHYHMIVEPKPDALYLVITSRLGLSREEALARFLAIHTIYPALPEWGEVLFGEGHKRKIVQKLDVFGMEWAYKAELWGWDEVIDRAAQDGLLTFPIDGNGQ